MTTPAALPTPPAFENVIDDIVEEAAGILPDPKIETVVSKRFYESKAFWALLIVGLAVTYYLYREGSKLDETENFDPIEPEPATHSNGASARPTWSPPPQRVAPPSLFGSND